MAQKGQLLGVLDNEPYAKATLLQTPTGKRFLLYETGPAAVVLPYRTTDKGVIEILLIREKRDLPEGGTETVLKTIGGFQRQDYQTPAEFYAFLVEREIHYRVTDLTQFIVIGRFPPFEIAELPVREVLIPWEALVASEGKQAEGDTHIVWVTLRDAARIAAFNRLDPSNTAEKFGDAAAEVEVLRLFTLLQLGELTL